MYQDHGNKRLKREPPSVRSFRFMMILFLLTGMLRPLAGTVNPGNRTPTEYEVKAAYLYYFAKFVNWPDDAFPFRNAPVIIGVFGDDQFGSLLQNVVKDKTIQEHPISIHLMKSVTDFRGCHIVFISASEMKRSKPIIESLQEHPVLTVTEADTNSQAKGIMNLFVESGKVQFEADISAAGRAHLEISSKLLRLARGSTMNRAARED